MYLRLSLEDEGDNDESNSITNQRKLIYEYINQDMELSKCEAVEYCDDGYSGTNMERPGIQKLFNEIKTRKTGCIIVKDMSRFSRDYIEMGTYLNRIFPFLGVRFIAVNDRYDSRECHGNTIGIDTAFRTLLYDMYSKDISVKVKTSIENKCANGEYVFGQTPFGYQKSGKNQIIINDNEAGIVRYIFGLALQGKTGTQIARRLYEENVPTITGMRNPKKKYPDDRVRSWSAAAVRNILNNRFYLGEMEYGKTVRKSVGDKRSRLIPKKDRKVIKNHHEPIVSEEIFDKVSSLKTPAPRKCYRKKHPVTGRLLCGGCGYSMIYKPAYGKRRCSHFECGKHSLLQIPDCCTYISAQLLEKTLLYMLNMEFMLCGNETGYKEKRHFFLALGTDSLNKRFEECMEEKKKMQAKKDSLYEEYALGKLGKEEYQKMADEFNDRISLLSQKEAHVSEKLHELQKSILESDKDTDKNAPQTYVFKLTGKAADTFIKKIYVYKNKRIEIEWNFSFDSSNLP